MTGNEFSVELASIDMTEFEDNKPVGCRVSFYVVRTDQDPPGTMGLFVIRNLPVYDDLNELVRVAREEMSLRCGTLQGSVDRKQPLMVRAP